MMPAMTGLRICSACVLALAGCATRAPVVRVAPDSAEWQTLHRKLDELRSARPREPWSAGIRVTLNEPLAGRSIEARGAIAVAPGKAVRMILVGGAGMTMLDAWVAPDRWRVAIPPRDLVRRGGSEEPRDLPIGFLRWWFFTPLEGTLFAGGETHSGTEWLLRDGDAVSDLLAGRCSAGSLLRVERRVRGRQEVVNECKSLSVPREGDWVKYTDDATGLRVDLVVESVSGEQPRPEAFSDPDGERGGT
jgi:hypothetical protein